MSFSGQPDTSLQIRLDTNIAQIGGRFRGTVIRGATVDDMDTSKRQTARGVRVTLIYETEGRGDRDTKSTFTHEFPVDAYGGVSAQFELPVGVGDPISYDGRLIRVKWKIEARIDLKMRIDPKVEVPVLVIPRNGWGVYTRPHPLSAPRSAPGPHDLQQDS